MAAITWFLFAGLGLALWADRLPAQQPASYAKDVRPFLARYCLECHNAKSLKGGLDLETFKGLQAGSDNGPVLVPGKPDGSPLVLLAEGKKSPRMPPQKAQRHPRPEEVRVLRAWVAAGAKDDSGSVKVVIPDIKPHRPVNAPVSALAYRPDGKRLAAGGYREAVLLDPLTGDVFSRLPGQIGAISALAFSRDGRHLAVASGVAGASGEVRIYRLTPEGQPGTTPEHVLTGHKDIIYDVAFSPDGQTLASCSYDRLIILWDVASGRFLRSLTKHSDSVFGVAFSPDGQWLISGAADRAVKIWEVATGLLVHTLGEATDGIYAVAWSPDGKHVAAGGIDRSIRVYELGPAGPKVVQSVFAHDGPVLWLAYASDGTSLYSLGADGIVKAWDPARLVERRIYPRQSEAVQAVAVRPDHKHLALGRYDGKALLLDEATGKVLAEPLPLKGPAFPVVSEIEPNDSPGTGQTIHLPATVLGSLGKAGDVDFYRFEARTGQQLGVQVSPAGGTKLDAVLQLTDAAGAILAESTDGSLGYTFAKPGWYALGIHDHEYRGGMNYRLHLGDLPVVTAVFPLGLRRGSEATIVLEGVNLGTAEGTSRAVRIKATADAVPGTRLPLPLGNKSVVVGEFPEVMGWHALRYAEGRAVDSTPFGVPQGVPPERLTVPGTANGCLAAPGTTDTWHFHATKGEPLVVEIEARRLGSLLDSTIEILDAKRHPVPRALLRCLAKTYMVFRDHDSAMPGIRIESWNELATNDYLYAGTELMRIYALPRNPDDDCEFFSRGRQRLGFLGTTPTHHAQGAPLYKVAIYPPGTPLAPNGFPIFTLYYRNDDGGPGFGRDSRLVFDPPADGTYQVRVADARGQGGRSYVYRLTVRPPQPSFNVRFTPAAPAVWKGGAVPVTLSADRIDDYAGPIAVRLENLPPAFSAPATTIPAGEDSTVLALYADPMAAPPAKTASIKLVARAVIDGREVVKEVPGGVLTLQEPRDLVTTTEQSEITLHPGGQVTMTVRVERLGGFAGRIPLDVRGLPHGVHVLDIGLNGILITEGATTRTFVISCEPWVQPQEHPFVVLARHERKNSEHAAKAVLLKIVGGK
jgi:WD40 repeat protein